jgi:hypothetical protein
MKSYLVPDATSELKETGNVPIGDMMSARQVLTWVAFKKVRGWSHRTETIDFINECGEFDTAAVLAALEARACPQPYCIVIPISSDGQPGGRPAPAKKMLSSEVPRLLRRIRANARQRESRLVTHSELATTLRSEMEIRAVENRALHRARLALTEALAAGRLVVWAKYGFSAAHDAVPANIFMDRFITITEWGDICRYPRSATEGYLGRLRFRDARFRTREVLAVWPVKTPGAESSSDTVVGVASMAASVASPGSDPERGPATSARTPGPGKPPRHDWDAFWVEAVLYASKNDLFETERLDFQRHMQEWTASNMQDPAPSLSEIRKRTAKIYNAVAAARNAGN